MKTINKLWMGILFLIILSPLGLLLPEYFKAGAAWGEWGSDEIKELVGYIPAGLEKFSGLWSAPIPGYAFKGWEEKGLGSLSLAYIFSAAIGMGLAILVIFLLGKLLVRQKERRVGE